MENYLCFRYNIQYSKDKKMRLEAFLGYYMLTADPENDLMEDIEYLVSEKIEDIDALAAEVEIYMNNAQVGML